MAGNAPLAIDLEAALGRGPVEGAEDALERPVPGGRFQCLRRPAGRAEDKAEDKRRDGKEGFERYRAFSIGSAAAPPATAPAPFTTGSLMLSGSGWGRSMNPRIGMRIRKWKK